MTTHELTTDHTRILRLALAVEESRAYWEQASPDLPVEGRALLAFEQRWFGSKSLNRVRFLLASFHERYDAFPDALAALHRWRSMDPTSRKLVCHLHLQLSDPLYRRFTGQFLVQRRGQEGATIDRDAVLRWVEQQHRERWSAATSVQFASKLLSAAKEAGLVSSGRDPRSLLVPKVPDVVIAYLLYLLRGLRFEGTLLDNPYLASLGLEGGYLDSRLRSLPGLGYHRMGHLQELDWAYSGLESFAKGEL